MKNRFLFSFIKKTFQVRKQNHRESTRSLLYKYVTENTNHVLILIFFPLLVAFFDSLTKTSANKGPILQKNLYLLESSSNFFNAWTLEYGSKATKKTKQIEPLNLGESVKQGTEISESSSLDAFFADELGKINRNQLFQLSDSCEASPQKKSSIQPFLKFREFDEFPSLLEKSKQNFEKFKLCETKTFYHITNDWDNSSTQPKYDFQVEKPVSDSDSCKTSLSTQVELETHKFTQTNSKPDFKKLGLWNEAYLFDKEIFSDLIQYNNTELLDLIESIRLVPQNEEKFVRSMSNFSFPDTKMNTTRNQQFWSTLCFGFPKQKMDVSFVKFSNTTTKELNLDSQANSITTRDLVSDERVNQTHTHLNINSQNKFFGAKSRPNTLNDAAGFEFEDNLLNESTIQSKFPMESFDDLVFNLAKHRQINEVDTEWEDNLSKLTKINSGSLMDEPGEPGKRDFSSRRFESSSSIEKDKNSFSSSYSKSPNYFEQNNLIESFTTTWEPLSINSWLVLTQFSFGFIVLHFMSSFYQQYGKEVILSCIDFLAELGFSLDELKQELGLSDESPALRVFQNINIGFDQVAGFDAFLPQIYEIVWFLKNKGRPLGSKIQFSNSLLLVGAPGTGKTYLVQAIAGESKVPVLVQSCSALLQEDGPEKLQDAFKQAREMSPCILFLDELDTIGVARKNILEVNETGSDILGKIYHNFGRENHGQFGFSNIESKELIKTSFLYPKQGQEMTSSSTGQSQENTSTQQANQQKVLTQLLRELDGLAKNHKIFVIGATNRVEILDLALTRPGRFNQVINIGLPTFQKRIELFKLYTKKLGCDKSIAWNQLAENTSGLSAAYISSIVNESSIHTIYEFLEHSTPDFLLKDLAQPKLPVTVSNQTTDEGSKTDNTTESKLITNQTFSTLKHTIKSLEKALDIITKSTTTGNQVRDLEKSSYELKNISPNNRRLLAYYQSGHTILKIIILESQKHFIPFKVSLYEPTEKTTRYNMLTQILSEFTLTYPTRLTLENLILEQFGGKAGEILSTYTLNSSKQFNSQKTFSQETTLGIECLAIASFLAQLLLFKIYGYPTNGVQENFVQISAPTELEYGQAGETVVRNQSNTQFNDLPKIKKLVINTLKTMQLHDWFRIRLSDPNETEQNVEWLPLSKTTHLNEWSDSALMEVDSDLNKINKETSFPGDNPVNSSQYLSDLATSNKMDPVSLFVKKYSAQKNYSTSFSSTWNDLKNEKTEVFLQALLIQSYDLAINILDQNRAWLDFLSFSLVKETTLNSNKVSDTASRFWLKSK